MSRSPAITTTPEACAGLAEEQADEGLFSAGGPFESFPGAVLVAGRNGVVLGANELAEPISRLLRSGASEELRQAVNAALDGKAAQINPLLIGAPNERSQTSQAFDLIALPWAEAPAALLLGRDITLERGLRAALLESRQRYKDLVEASSDFAWETDTAGRFTFISSEEALGYLASNLVGRAAADLVMESGSTDFSPFTTREPLDSVEVWLRRHDGTPACLSVVALPLVDDGGTFSGVRGQCRDVTLERAQASDIARARQRERLFAHVLRDLRDACEPRHFIASIAAQLLPALGASGVVVLRANSVGLFSPVASAGQTLPVDDLDPLLTRLAAGESKIEADAQVRRILLVQTAHREQCNGALCVWHGLPASRIGEDDHFLIEEMASQIGAVMDRIADGHLPLGTAKS